VAAVLKQDPRLEVELVNGHYGEFAVLVDGEEVAKGGPLGFAGLLPGVEEVRALVEKRLPGPA
jgi:hypothetical protein